MCDVKIEESKVFMMADWLKWRRALWEADWVSHETEFTAEELAGREHEAYEAWCEYYWWDDLLEELGDLKTFLKANVKAAGRRVDRAERANERANAKQAAAAGAEQGRTTDE
jgi:hypothetical protein